MAEISLSWFDSIQWPWGNKKDLLILQIFGIPFRYARMPDTEASYRMGLGQRRISILVKTTNIVDYQRDVLEFDANKIDGLWQDFADFKEQYQSNIKDLRNDAKAATLEIKTVERQIKGKSSVLETQFRQDTQLHTDAIKPILDDHFNQISQRYRLIRILCLCSLLLLRKCEAYYMVMRTRLLKQLPLLRKTLEQ